MKSSIQFHLRQETPMCHFQCREHESQSGATLRASDVKPRLDKFLVRQMSAAGLDWKSFRISPEHDALNYKLHIVAKGSPKVNEIKENAFFANMGSKDKERSVCYPQGVDLKIICFIPGLMDQIQKHIQGFFLINNFGTRQDKGFGSFVVDGMDGQSIPVDTPTIETFLKNYSGNEGYSVYGINTAGCSDKSAVLDNAYVLYQWIKSGINFGATYQKSLLTEYMLEKRVGGEKRWMKQEGIAPKVKSGPGKTKEPDDRPPVGEVDEYRYIRAVLGVSGNQSWFTSKKKDMPDKNGNPAYFKDEISVSSAEINRYPSPITIKIVDKKVFFLAYDLSREPFNVIFDKEFTFANSRSKQGNLSTLSEFDMEVFLNYCAEKIRNVTFDVRGNHYSFSMIKINSGGAK